MYPVRLCLHILPDAFWHVVAGSWSVSLAMLGCVRFFLNVFKYAGFRSESCGISGLCKVEEFPTMNATAMRFSAMPSGGIGSLSLLFWSLPASKPLFFNKGLLLSDQSLSGHHFHTNSAIMTREDCCHDGRSFTPRNPVFEDFRVFFFFFKKSCKIGNMDGS